MQHPADDRLRARERPHLHRRRFRHPRRQRRARPERSHAHRPGHGPADLAEPAARQRRRARRWSHRCHGPERKDRLVLHRHLLRRHDALEHRGRHEHSQPLRLLHPRVDGHHDQGLVGAGEHLWAASAGLEQQRRPAQRPEPPDLQQSRRLRHLPVPQRWQQDLRERHRHERQLGHLVQRGEGQHDLPQQRQGQPPAGERQQPRREPVVRPGDERGQLVVGLHRKGWRRRLHRRHAVPDPRPRWCRRRLPVRVARRLEDEASLDDRPLSAAGRASAA